MSKQRDRELARAKYERQSVRRNQVAMRNHLIKRALWGIGAIAVLGFVLSGQGSRSNVATPIETAAPSAVGTSAAATSPATDTPQAVASCTPPVAIRANNINYGSEPTGAVAAKQITFDTNCGKIVVATDDKAPKTAGIMSLLAKGKFFDATKCHRLTTSGLFVLQCGDPTATGGGGPGFSFADENLPKDASYPRGTVAMANSGPNTNGSQFFFVYQDSPLPPNYSVWGKITSGLDVLDAVAAAGVQGGGTDGTPVQDVVISTVTTTE